MKVRLNPRPAFKTRDSALAYYISQLENFDPRLYEPLVSTTYARDIKFRSGITMGNEATSFTRSSFAGQGTLQNSVGNMPWISKETTAIPGVMVNGEKIVLPLRLLGREVSFTSVELDRSKNTQQPIDVQQLNAMNMLYQMNIDQMVYIGSSDVSATGLINDGGVAVGTVATGVNGSTLWTTKTPDEILQDVNKLLTDTWTASAYAVCPSKLLLPATNFSYIATAKVSSAGNVSILKYLQENSIALIENGRPLEIVSNKWLAGAGVGPSNRMVAYTNEENYVRFPMVPIRRETPYYLGIRYTSPYIWAFGELELVYPETIRYADGI